MIFLILSCDSSKRPEIGFLLPNLTDARYPKDRDYFVEKVNQLGGKVEIGDAQNDPYLQEKQAQQMVKNGAVVLVICPVNQNLAASIVRFASEHRVKIIAYERLIQNCNLDYFITFDNYNVGRQQANYAINKKLGNYVLMEGDKRDKNAELIKMGQMAVINPLVESGKIKIIYNVFIEDWNESNAYMEMCKVLQLSGEKIDVVLSANDGMAGGIIKALENNQPDYPFIITGLDADLDACRRIIKGKQSMTVYKSFKKQARITAELAVKIAKGEPFKDANETIWNGMNKIQTISLQSIVVDSTNMVKTIVGDGIYSENDVKEYYLE